MSPAAVRPAGGIAAALRFGFVLCALACAAPPLRAGDHLTYENYEDRIEVDAQGKAQHHMVRRLRVNDVEGVGQVFGEFTLHYFAKSSRRREFKCERRTADGRSDRFFRFEAAKFNVSTTGMLTDEVAEHPIFSRVMAGDVIECGATVEHDSVDFITLRIEDAFPVMQRRIEITAASPERLSFLVTNGELPPRREGGKLVWALSDVKPVAEGYPGQSLEDLARVIRLHYATMNFFGTATPVGDWQQIAAWVRSNTRPAQTLDPALEKRLQALVAGTATDRDKASRIYDWVRNEHRYVALELGKGGWTPRAAAETAGNRYGDCKDFANLFIALARGAGLKTAVVLANASDSGRLDPAFAAPFQFDHELAAVWLDGGWTFADATHKYLELGLMRDDYEGTRALLVPDAGEAAIITLPVSTADDNHVVWDLAAAPQDGATLLTGRNHRHGALAGDFRMAMDTVDAAYNLNNNMLRWLSPWLLHGSDLTIAGNYRDVHKPVQLELSGRLPDLVKMDGDRRYVRLLPVAFERVVASGVPQPGAPIRLGRRESDLISVQWRLDRPEAVLPPETVNFTTPFGYFRLVAEKTPDGLKVDREFAVTRDEITPAEFPAYKAFIARALELHNQYFDLGPLSGPPRPASAGGAKAPPPARKPPPRAAGKPVKKP